jgi:hypothetical protein
MSWLDTNRNIFGEAHIDLRRRGVRNEGVLACDRDLHGGEGNGGMRLQELIVGPALGLRREIRAVDFYPGAGRYGGGPTKVAGRIEWPVWFGRRRLAPPQWREQREWQACF